MEVSLDAVQSSLQQELDGEVGTVFAGITTNSCLFFVFLFCSFVFVVGSFVLLTLLSFSPSSRWSERDLIICCRWC